MVGCGVSGLTCAIRLMEEGFSVRIVARSLPPNTTSNVAAALWYPYRALPADRVQAWSLGSLARFSELAGDRASGVSMIEMHEVFESPDAVPGWRSSIPRFRVLAGDELPDGFGSGFSMVVPLIETPTYLPFLMDRFEAMGGEIEELESEIETLEALAGEAPLVVNCSGLGARRLAGDELVFPIRGQVVRTTGGGITRAIVDEEKASAATYVVPRSHDCILGTTTEENEWSEDADPAATDAILERCERLDARVRRVEVLDVRVGLRPGRTAVRVEAETVGRMPVIHNYGHGGSGFTLSWGCAEEVVTLAKRAVSES